MWRTTLVVVVLLSVVAVTMAEQPIVGGTRSRLSGSHQVPSSQIGATLGPDLRSHSDDVSREGGEFERVGEAAESTFEPCQEPAWSLRDGLLSFLCDNQDQHHITGFLDFNYYWDTREFNVLTINSGAKLPHDFEFFQLLNLFGEFGNASDRENWTGFFTELNLRRPIAKESDLLKHLDWTVQWADGSGPREVLRLGVRWRFQDTPGPIGEFFRDVLKLKYSIDFHVIEDDGSGWQIEHVFQREFFGGLIYAAGFADHNINGFDDSSDWVVEPQVGLKLAKNFYAIAEYRYSSFAPNEFKSGWGFGLQYVVRFE
jgi:hypothetical protein